MATHHHPDIHLGSGLVVRIVADLGDRTGHSEEQHIREVVGHDLLLATGERMEFPPSGRQSDVEVSGVVDDLSQSGFVVAHGVEGVQEVVLGERLVREPSEEGKVGGGDPGAELGRTLRVEDSVDRPGGEMGARKGESGTELRLPIRLIVSRNSRSSARVQSSPTAPARENRGVAPDPGWIRPFLLGTSLGAEITNELADDLFPSRWERHSSR